jgi:glycosyltransferase involved in cell wall biosynthesis
VYNYLFRRFRDCGWDLQVASDKMLRESAQGLKFKFHEVPFKFSLYRRLIRETRPDAVMFHLHLKIPLFWTLLHWLRFQRMPVISWTKGANLDRADSRFRYQLFNYAHSLSDALVLYSANQTNYVKPRHRHKIFAANNTVNFEDYPEVKETKAQLKSEFNLPFEKIVLFVGTMGIDGERKRVAHLIEIFRKLNRPDVGLLLVGSGMSPELQARINPINTRLLGQVHDPRNVRISKLFKLSDLFVVPGHVGLGINQAFYWGLPVVTEQCLQPPEIQYLKHGRNGYIVPDNDLAELETRMLYLLDNYDVRRQFSEHASQDIRREASIEGMFLGFRNALEYASRSRLGDSLAPAITGGVNSVMSSGN